MSTQWYWVRYKGDNELMWVLEIEHEDNFLMVGWEIPVWKEEFEILRGPFTVEQIDKELVFTGTIECNAIQVSHNEGDKEHG